MPRALPVCPRCLKAGNEYALKVALDTHKRIMAKEGLTVPERRSSSQVLCRLCANHCALGEGQRGLCDVRVGQKGSVKYVFPNGKTAAVDFYYDPLPTNCCASFVCPAGTGAGFPHYAYRDGPEFGFVNLAVFYEACNFHCLFCQNYHFRNHKKVGRKTLTPEEIVLAITKRTSCICFFGGDPTPQLPHALLVSKLAKQAHKGRILRICFETNGATSRALLEAMIEVCLESGGCIKFDLKAWDNNIHRALCYASNEATLENFEFASRFVSKRKTPPLLIATTLLVPRYVDEQEVSNIARFIASLDKDIPYSLLVFRGAYHFSDLPATPKEQVLRCLEAAKTQGLTRVHLGNMHLLSI